jgi:amidase
MTRHILTADHTIYVFSSVYEPALRARPGDEVVFELRDVGGGQFRRETDLYDPATYDNEHDHPMTGPVEIEGAEPGDILSVEIREIEPWDWGFILLAPEFGVLRHRVRRATKIVPIKDGYCLFDDRIRFPVRPMVGTIGVSPAEQEVRGVLPGTHGGNLDNIYITIGSKVYLPVNVPGAGLAMADLHASMGDGECCISGIETGGSVVTSIQLIKGKRIQGPVVETDKLWMTMGDHHDLERAIKIACEQMLDLLVDEWDLSPEEAFMLMSVRADIGICQCAAPDILPCVVRVTLPKLPGLPGPFNLEDVS